MLKPILGLGAYIHTAQLRGESFSAAITVTYYRAAIATTRAMSYSPFPGGQGYTRTTSSFLIAVIDSIVRFFFSFLDTHY